MTDRDSTQAVPTIPELSIQPRYEFSFLFGAGAFLLIGLATVGLGIAVMALSGSLGAGLATLLGFFAVTFFVIYKRLEKLRAKRGESLKPITLRAGRLTIPNRKETDELSIDVTQPFVMQTAWEYIPASHVDSAAGGPRVNTATYQTMLMLEQDGRRAQLYSHEVIFKKTLQKIEFLAPGEVPAADWAHKQEYVAQRNVVLKDIVSLFRVLRRCAGVELRTRREGK